VQPQSRCSYLTSRCSRETTVRSRPIRTSIWRVNPVLYTARCSLKAESWQVDGGASPGCVLPAQITVCPAREDRRQADPARWTRSAGYDATLTAKPCRSMGVVRLPSLVCCASENPHCWVSIDNRQWIQLETELLDIAACILERVERKTWRMTDRRRLVYCRCHVFEKTEAD